LNGESRQRSGYFGGKEVFAKDSGPCRKLADGIHQFNHQAGNSVMTFKASGCGRAPFRLAGNPKTSANKSCLWQSAF